MAIKFFSNPGEALLHRNSLRLCQRLIEGPVQSRKAISKLASGLIQPYSKSAVLRLTVVSNMCLLVEYVLLCKNVFYDSGGHTIPCPKESTEERECAGANLCKEMYDGDSYRDCSKGGPELLVKRKRGSEECESCRDEKLLDVAREAERLNIESRGRTAKLVHGTWRQRRVRDIIVQASGRQQSAFRAPMIDEGGQASRHREAAPEDPFMNENGQGQLHKDLGEATSEAT